MTGRARGGGLGLLLVRSGALLLGTMFLGSLAVSPAPFRSLPWVLMGSAGVAVVVCSSYLPRLQQPEVAVRYLRWVMGLGYFLLLAGVLVVDWPEQKLSWLAPLYGNLPTLRGLPISGLEKGLQPNQIGGVLAVVGAFAFGNAVSERPPAETPRSRRRWRVTSWPLFGLCAVAVFLTGSRAGLAALGLAALATLIVRNRRWLWIPGALLLTAALAVTFAPHVLADALDIFLRDETVSTKLVARLDIWASALKGIEDHAFTGIGLGVFNDIVPARYPYETVGLSYTVSQAHNIFLDTALALGIPGCLGLLSMVTGLVITSLKTIHSPCFTCAASTAALSGLVAFFAFGMTDSLAFSNPSSLTLWFCSFGIVVAMRLTPNSTGYSISRYDTEPFT